MTPHLYGRATFSRLHLSDYITQLLLLILALVAVLVGSLREFQELRQHSTTSTASFGSVSLGTTSHRYDATGTCNTTSYGYVYADGNQYAPMMLRGALYPDPDGRHRKWSSTCSYRFIGTSDQRIWIELKQLNVGRYNYRTRSCDGGQLSIFDGDPGNHRFPPHTFCGLYSSTNASVLTSGHVAEAELTSFTRNATSTADADDEDDDGVVWSFVAAFKYVNAGDKENYQHQKNAMRPVHDAAYICTWLIMMDDCGAGQTTSRQFSSATAYHECSILSPGYPANYPPNTECTYHMTSQDFNTAIQMKFTNSEGDDVIVGATVPHISHRQLRQFDVRATDGCTEDYVEIYDGLSASSPKIGRFCGKAIPDITSSSNHLYVVFGSGPSTPPYGFAGFHGSLIGVTKDWFPGGVKSVATPCDWTFNSTEGSVSTPDHWLPPATKCTYLFYLLPQHHLDVIISIYGLRPSCADHISLFEGRRLVRQLCSDVSQSFVATAPGDDRRISDLTPQQPTFGRSPAETRSHSKTTVSQYQLRDRRAVSVQYVTSSGQWQSSPDRGFWLSFKQRRDDTVSQPVTPPLPAGAHPGILRPSASDSLGGGGPHAAGHQRQKSVDRRAGDGISSATRRLAAPSKASASAVTATAAAAAAAAATVIAVSALIFNGKPYGISLLKT